MDEITPTNNMPQPEEGGRTPSPPYISFLTFINFLIWLETEGVPLQFDGSFWRRKYSGSTGFQLMSGLRFLGLLKGDKPQQILEDLVEAKGDDRKTRLAEALMKSYTAVEFHSLARATPKMLANWFAGYGIEGDTQRKAESFFINACKFVDISLSPSLSKKARNKPTKSASKGPVKERRKREQAASQKDKGTQLKGSAREGIQVSKVALNSGGDITLAINVDIFRLSIEDREFVLKLVDLVKGYNKKEESAGEDILS